MATACTDCPAPATTTFEEARGDWGFASLPVCVPCQKTRQSQPEVRPFRVGF